MSADSQRPADFRETTRAPIEAPATMQMDAFSEPQSGYTANVSVGGMFVQMKDPPPVGSIVKYELGLGDPPSTIRGTAEVVWIRARGQGPQHPSGAGLQYRFIEGDGETLLRDTLEKALEELGPEPEPAPVPRRPRPPRPARPPARQRPAPTGRGKPSTPKKVAPKKKKPTDEGKQILGMPAEKAKLILLLALVALLLLTFVL